MQSRVIPELRPRIVAHPLLSAFLSLSSGPMFRQSRDKARVNRYTPCATCGKLTKWSQCHSCAATEEAVAAR